MLDFSKPLVPQFQLLARSGDPVIAHAAQAWLRANLEAQRYADWYQAQPEDPSLAYPDALIAFRSKPQLRVVR